MTRRDLFRRLLGAAVAATVAPVLSETVVVDADTGIAMRLIREWGASVPLRVGDVFTIAGHYEMDPFTRTPTGQLQRFVVTAMVSSDAG